MNKLSKEKKQNLILVCVGTVVLLGVLWYFGIQPLKERNKTMLEGIENTRQAVANAVRTVQSAPQIHDELVLVTQKLKALEDKMITGDTNVWIRTTVINFKGTGFYKLDIPQYSTADATPLGMFPEFPYKATRYRLSGTAFYHDLGRFIADFENQFPHIRVQNLEVYPVDASVSDEREKLSFNFEVVALSKPTLTPVPTKP